MRVLVIGGTRFIGVYLTKQLVEQDHQVTLLNRGNQPAPVDGVETILCDRTDPTALQKALSDQSFDAIFDNNGRELENTQPLAELFKGKLKHFIYVSSAGVYAKRDQMPHVEGDPVDPNSRHKGKFHTEDYLKEQGLPFTAIRPVYLEDFDFGKKKAFPMRVQHFFTDISKAKTELDWQPQFSLIAGLKDAFENDYLANDRHKGEVDFSLDDHILSQMTA